MRIFHFLSLLLTYLELLRPSTSFLVDSFNTESMEEFILETETYQEWSNWSPCRINCKRNRERKCLASGCAVSVIREISPCKDHQNCEGKESLYLSTKTLTSLPQNCGLKPETKDYGHKIYGGKAAKPNSWPWMLAIGYKGYFSSDYICGATLISPRWAITAAHCTTDLLYNRYNHGKLISINKTFGFVKVNNYHKIARDEKEFIVPISEIIVHPQYRTGKSYTNYDFALLRLIDDIKPGPLHGFACITDDENFTLPLKSECFATGWGRQTHAITFLPEIYDDRLQEAKLSILSYNLCKWYYNNIYINYTIHVCSGSDHKDTCVGDSGGGFYCRHPVTQRWNLYGIISFGSDAGCGEAYGVNSKVSAAVRWIDDTIRGTKFSG